MIDAVALRDTVNGWLDELKADPPEGWAVNWADVKVVDVLYERSLLHNDPNHYYYRVLIGEANCPELEGVLGDKAFDLPGYSWHPVYFTTEW